MRKAVTVGCMAIAVAITVPAHAAAVTWDAHGYYITAWDTNEVLNGGTYNKYVYAVTTYESDITINGVLFHRRTSQPWQNASNQWQFAAAGPVSITVTTPWSGEGNYSNGGSSDYNHLVSYNDRANESQSTDRHIDISGLIPGTEYQIQIWGPSWNYAGGWWYFYYDDQLMYCTAYYGPPDNTPEYLIGTFLAESSSLSLPIVAGNTKSWGPCAVSLFTQPKGAILIVR